MAPPLLQSPIDLNDSSQLQTQGSLVLTLHVDSTNEVPSDVYCGNCRKFAPGWVFPTKVDSLWLENIPSTKIAPATVWIDQLICTPKIYTPGPRNCILSQKPSVKWYWKMTSLTLFSWFSKDNPNTKNVKSRTTDSSTRYNGN
jgi:hypothetical protein